MGLVKKKGKLSDSEDGQSEVGGSSSCESSISGSWGQLSSTSTEQYEADPSSSSSMLSSPEQSARFDSPSPIEPRQNQDQLEGIHFSGRRSASLDYLPPSPLQPFPSPSVDRTAHFYYPAPPIPTHLYSNDPLPFQTGTNFPSSSIRHNYSTSLPTESQYWDGLPTPTTAGSFSEFQQAQESHSFPTRVTVSSAVVVPPPPFSSPEHFPPPYQYHSNPSPNTYYDPFHQSQQFHSQHQVPLVPIPNTSNYNPYSAHQRPHPSTNMLEQTQPFQFNQHLNLPYPNSNLNSNILPTMNVNQQIYHSESQFQSQSQTQQDLQQYSISNSSNLIVPTSTRTEREIPIPNPIFIPRTSQVEWEFEENRNNDEGEGEGE